MNRPTYSTRTYARNGNGYGDVLADGQPIIGLERLNGHVAARVMAALQQAWTAGYRAGLADGMGPADPLDRTAAECPDCPAGGPHTWAWQEAFECHASPPPQEEEL